VLARVFQFHRQRSWRSTGTGREFRWPARRTVQNTCQRGTNIFYQRSVEDQRKDKEYSHVARPYSVAHGQTRRIAFHIHAFDILASYKSTRSFKIEHSLVEGSPLNYATYQMLVITPSFLLSLVSPLAVVRRFPRTRSNY